MGEAVRETIDRCERLIEALLMLARSEAAAGREEPVDLSALAADCVTDLRARAREADVEVRDDLEPAWTQGDPALLERMIANLIENGIRHNQPGGHLRVSTWSVGGRVRVTVSNGGPLIDPADAQMLTEPFRRLDRGTAGSGWVCRSCARWSWRTAARSRSGRRRRAGSRSGSSCRRSRGRPSRSYLRGSQECLRRADTYAATTLRHRDLRFQSRARSACPPPGNGLPLP